MSGEWSELPIGDVATVIGGGTPSTKDGSNFNGSIPWLTPKDLSGYPYRYISRGERNISEKGLMSSSARLLPEGAVLLTTRAPVGYVAIASNSVTTNQGFRSLVLQEGFHPEFIYYLLKSKTDLLKAHASGTTFGELSGTTLKGLRFMFPPLLEQRAIVAILGALDDKIELNRRMNKTLEEIAQAIFKSWFIDFEPFRDHGVEDSTIGTIPRGWRVAELRDLCKVAIGGDWGHDEPFEGAVKATCLRGVDLEHLRRDGWADAPQRWFKKGSLDKRRLTDKDVLIAASGIGPLGRPLWVHPLLSIIFPLPLLYSNFCKRFITPSPHHAVYVERILLNMRENYQIWEYATGTSVPNLDVDGLLKHLIVVPSEDLLSRFYDFVLLTYSKLYSSESRTIATLRDTLLPKLLSGQIRVKDAEKFVEKAI